MINCDFLTVTDLSTRDSIALVDRSAGMLVWTQSTNQLWLLGAGLSNSDWTDVTSGIVPSVVLSTTELSSLSVTNLPDGFSIKVVDKSTGKNFIAKYDLYKTSSASADGTNVLTANGGGRWIRQRRYWIAEYHSQQLWKVDFASGNDQNDGLTNTTALKTIAEFNKRVWLHPKSYNFNVQILSSPPSSDPIQWDGCLEEGTGIPGSGTGGLTTPNPLARPTIIFSGSSTTVATGTVTSMVVEAQISNTPWQLKDVGVPNWNVFSNGNYAVRFSSGPLTGYTCFIDEDIGTNTARISTPVLKTLSVTTNTSATAAVGANPGDTYEIISFLQVPNTYLDTGSPNLTIQTIDFYHTNTFSPTLSCVSGIVTLNRSVIGQNISAIGGATRPILINCHLLSGTTLNGSLFSNTILDWCLSSGSIVFTSAQGTLVSTLIHNISAVTVSGAGASCGVTNCSAWKCTFAFYATSSGRINVSGQLSGTGNGSVFRTGGGGLGCTGQSTILLNKNADLNGAYPIQGGVGAVELMLNQQPAHIPAISVGPVVAAPACTTLAQWRAAPFNYVAVDVDGSGLVAIS